MAQETKAVNETVTVRDGAPGQGTNARAVLTISNITATVAQGTNALAALTVTNVTATVAQGTNALAALIIGFGFTPAGQGTNARAELRFGTSRRAVWVTEDAPSASTWRTE
jgi:hypothetical protein